MADGPEKRAEVRRSAAESAVLLIVRLAVAGVFLFASWAKLSNLNKFSFSVNSFELIHGPVATFATYAIPYLELALGLAVGVGFKARWAAAGLSVMLIAFIGAIVSVLARGMVIRCTCFGDYDLVCEGYLSVCNVVSNTVVLALAALVAARGPGRWTVDRLL